MEEGIEAERSLMKREKSRGPKPILAEHLKDSKGVTFVTLINHTSAPIRNERSSPTSTPRREASRNKFVKKGECQMESKALEKSIVAKSSESPAWVC